MWLCNCLIWISGQIFSADQGLPTNHLLQQLIWDVACRFLIGLHVATTLTHNIILPQKEHIFAVLLFLLWLLFYYRNSKTKILEKAALAQRREASCTVSLIWALYLSWQQQLKSLTMVKSATRFLNPRGRVCPSPKTRLAHFARPTWRAIHWVVPPRSPPATVTCRWTPSIPSPAHPFPVTATGSARRHRSNMRWWATREGHSGN